MTPLRGLKGCCHLLFCGNGIDFYSAPSGLNFPICNLSTGLHPVLICDTPSGLERLLPFVVLWQTLEEGKPDNLRVASAKITVYRERPNSTRPERLLINSEG